MNDKSKKEEAEKILSYLDGQLPRGEAHDIEQQMAEDEFMNDAVEGLETFTNKAALPAYVEQLNQSLKTQVAKNKKRKQKRKLQQQPWLYFAIILILLLSIIAYLVISRKQ